MSESEPSKQGELRYNGLIIVIGFACLSFVGLTIYALFYDKDVWCKRSELIAVISLLTGFGLGAIYSFSEYFLTRGHYDGRTISFYTPLTGAKKEHWRDLKSAYFSDSMSWYVLTFKSGKVIRLSTFLCGHQGVVRLLSHYGFDV